MRLLTYWQPLWIVLWLQREISHTDWTQQAEAVGMGAYQIETLLQMFVYYQENGFVGNCNILTWLVGRKPTTFLQFVEAYL